jgi:hypothetical protein
MHVKTETYKRTEDDVGSAWGSQHLLFPRPPDCFIMKALCTRNYATTIEYNYESVLRSRTSPAQYAPPRLRPTRRLRPPRKQSQQIRQRNCSLMVSGHARGCRGTGTHEVPDRDEDTCDRVDDGHDDRDDGGDDRLDATSDSRDDGALQNTRSAPIGGAKAQGVRIP